MQEHSSEAVQQDFAYLAYDTQGVNDSVVTSTTSNYYEYLKKI